MSLNEYDGLIQNSEPQEGQSQENEYDALIRGQRQSQEIGLRAAIKKSSQVQPDRQAKIFEISKARNLPADYVSRHFDLFEKENAIEKFDYNKTIEETPRFAKWLQDPGNAALVKDDVEHLGNIERAGIFAKDLLGSAVQGAGSVVGSSIEGAGSLYEMADRNLRSALGLYKGPAQGLTRYFDPSTVLRGVGKDVNIATGLLAPPKERESLVNDIANGVGQMGGQIATMVLTPAKYATLVSNAQLFFQGADQMAQKMETSQAPQWKKDLAVLGGAGVTAISERTGLDIIVDKLPANIRSNFIGVVTKTLLSGGAEAAEELVEGVGQDLIQLGFTKDKIQFLDGIQRQMEAAGGAGAVTGLILSGLINGSKTSRMRELSAEKYREIVEAQLNGTPLQTSYIHSDRLDEQFGERARDKVIQIAGSAKAYDDAKAQGGGLVGFPTANWMANADLEADGKFLLENLTTDPLYQTAAETKASVKGEADKLNAPEKSLEPHIAINKAIELVGPEALKERAKSVQPQEGKTNEEGKRRITTTSGETVLISGALAREIGPQMLDVAVSQAKEDIEAQSEKNPVLNYLKANPISASSGEMKSFLKNAEIKVSEISAIISKKKGSDVSRDIDSAAQDLTDPNVAAQFGIAPFSDDISARAAIEEAITELRNRPKVEPRSLSSRVEEKAGRLVELKKFLFYSDALQKLETLPTEAKLQADYAIETGDLGLLKQAFDSVGVPVISALENTKEQSLEKAARMVLAEDRIAKRSKERAQEKVTARELKEISDAISSQFKLAGRPASEARSAGVIGSRIVSRLASVSGKNAKQYYVERFPQIAQVDEGQPGALEQAAYHGSPYTFDKFSLQRIGSGEGGMAYGWGLYFAGNKQTAEFYRDALSNESVYLDGEKIKDLNTNNPRDAAASTLSDETIRGQAVTKKMVSNLIDRIDNLDMADDKRPWFEEYKKEAMSLIGHTLERRGDGKIYEVEIPNKDSLLNWDANLFDESKQPSKVLDAIDRIIKANPLFFAGGQLAAAKRGRDFYNALVTMTRSPELASKLLLDNGVQGIQYLDAHSRDEGEGTKNYVIFDDKLININRFEQTDADKKGFYERLRNVIGLFAKADVTTLHHELTHFYITELERLESENTLSDQGKEDMRIYREFVGAKEGERLTKEQHEKGARGFEAFIIEGKAPSKKLRGFFYRMSRLFLKVYQDIKNLGVELSPAIRGFYDRMLATDQEIERIRAEEHLEPLFKNAKDAGMSDVAAELYARKVSESREAMFEKRVQEQFRDIARREKREYKEKYAAEREKVAAEVNADPLYVAIDALSKGETEDGTNLKDVHPDTQALLLGFQSGDEMQSEIRNAEPKEIRINRITKDRMDARSGERKTTEQMQEEAVYAAFNEDQAEVALMEMEHLMANAPSTAMNITKAFTSGKLPDVAAIREQALETIQAKQIQDIRPNIYQANARKAAKDAFEALKAGDRQSAFDSKRLQLINQIYYTTAVQELRQIDRDKSYARAIQEKDRLAKIEKQGSPEYVFQIIRLLERFGLREPLPKNADHKSLADFVRILKTQLFDLEIGQKFLDEGFTKASVNEMTAGDLHSLITSIKGIVSVAQHLDSEEFIKGLEPGIEAAKKSGKAAKGAPEPGHEGRASKWRGFAVKFDGNLVKIETLAEVLDGGPVGWWHDRLINPASRAQAQMSDLLKEIQRPLQKVLEDYAKDNRGSDTDQFQTRLREKPFSRKELITMAFNFGTNRENLLEGHGWKGKEALVVEALSNLSKKDIDFVNQTQKLIEPLFKKLAEVKELATGTPLRKLRHSAFNLTLKSGERVTLDGGYFPLVADPKHRVGEIQSQSAMSDLLGEGFTGGVSAESSASQERTGATYPLLLNYQTVLQRHLLGVTKDIAYRKFLIDAHRILSNTKIKDALRDRFGSEYEQLFYGSREKPGWLRYVAAENVSPIGGDQTLLDDVAQFFRSRAVIFAIGYKASSILVQGTGMFPAVNYFKNTYRGYGGASHYWRALKEFYKNPITNLSKTNPKSLRYQNEAESGEMKYLGDNFDREASDLKKKMEANKSKLTKLEQVVARSEIAGLAYANMMVAQSVYMAGKQAAIAKGIKDGKPITEQQAIGAGEAAVRQSQGAGRAKDLTKVQQKKGVHSLLTMFMTPFMANYNQVHATGSRMRSKGYLRYTPELIGTMILVYSLPNIIADLIKGNEPDDDDKMSKAEWFVWKTVSGPLESIPILRDGVQTAEYQLKKKGKIDVSSLPADTRFSPVIGSISRAVTGVSDALESTFGDKEWSDETFFDFVNAIGFGIGLPTDQAAITGEYLLDLLNGEAQPKDPLEAMRGILLRRKYQERRGQ